MAIVDDIDYMFSSQRCPFPGEKESANDAPSASTTMSEDAGVGECLRRLELPSAVLKRGWLRLNI